MSGFFWKGLFFPFCCRSGNPSEEFVSDFKCCSRQIGSGFKISGWQASRDAAATL